jgi:signal transduction histidine kinase
MVNESTIKLAKTNVFLEEKQEEINLQNEELLSQRDDLEKTNAILLKQQQQINHQNEELMTQRDSVSEINKILEEQKEQILEQNSELDRHRNDLEILIDERTQQLIAAKNKAEEADKLKSSFLANLSHEIRTPLNAIIGFSNLIIDDQQVTKDEKENFNRIIKASSDSLLNLINDIIDFSKIESGHIDIILREISLKKIMVDIHSIFELQLNKQQISEHNIQFKVVTSDAIDNLYIETDEVRVNQILSNLIQNAIKFTTHGFIEVGCYLQAANEMIEFYVKDTGIGIKKEYHEIIFERFRKVEDDKTKLHRGAGIGLAISQQLVNLLGGQIRVESEYGSGSTFYFTLPIKSTSILKEKYVTEKKIKEGITDFHGVKVLVAEDDLANHAYIEKLLQKFNISVIHAINGIQVMQLLSKHPEIKIVLMDIKMPEVDGIEAFHMMREAGINIPVIAQTAYALAHEIVKLKQEGFDDYISKPLSLTDIKKVLQKWL